MTKFLKKGTLFDDCQTICMHISIVLLSQKNGEIQLLLVDKDRIAKIFRTPTAVLSINYGVELIANLHFLRVRGLVSNIKRRLMMSVVIEEFADARSDNTRNKNIVVPISDNYISLQPPVVSSDGDSGEQLIARWSHRHIR